MDGWPFFHHHPVPFLLYVSYRYPQAKGDLDLDLLALVKQGGVPVPTNDPPRQKTPSPQPPPGRASPGPRTSPGRVSPAVKR